MTKHKAEDAAPEPAEKPLAVGDLVTHCAPGSPEMEVTQVRPDDHFLCRWWEAGRGLQTATFTAGELRRVAPKPAHGHGPAVTK